ncbi:hypothetical protein BLOT_010727 [Blomia tropicalis]|nr:hypothetical protein BLOT_010727 [Blomia tropicalis]
MKILSTLKMKNKYINSITTPIYKIEVIYSCYTVKTCVYVCFRTDSEILCRMKFVGIARTKTQICLMEKLESQSQCLLRSFFHSCGHANLFLEIKI